MKTLLFFAFTIAFIFSNTTSFSQNFEWAISYGGTGSDELGGSVIDAPGNVYTVGNFQGTVDFDPGVGVFNLTTATPGFYDAYVSKSDAAGNFQWALSIGGNNSTFSRAIALDGSGNIYITGSFNGTTDFDPGVGVFNLTSAIYSDVFICKLDASGNFIWVKSIACSGGGSGNSITVDASGFVYTTGGFQGTGDFDPGAGTFNLTAPGPLTSYNIFISKLDASGNFVWAKSIGGTESDQGYCIAVDGTGNVYTTGYYQLTADFDPGAGIFNLTAVQNGDIFISKLDNSGNFLWAKSMGSTDYDHGRELVLDAAGNVYTTGVFRGTVDFDPGAGTNNLTASGSSYDIFISKLDAAGSFVWAKKWGGSSDDYGTSIKLDASNNLYFAGHFQATVDFDAGPGTTNLTSAGSYDTFVSKLDPAGNFIWAKSTGGTSNDFVVSVQIDNTTNAIYLSGLFAGTSDFNPDAGTFNLSSVGSNDAYVLKLSQCSPNTGIDVQTACNSYTWIDGNTYTSSNSSATHTLTNIAGCDSTVTLNLTITNSNSATDTQIACDSYTWIDGNTYTSSNNMATHTLTNIAGCDSVVTLNLTITNSNAGTAVVSACDAYTWIDGNTYNASNSSATHTLTNVAGCDSVVTLNLTINSSYNQSQNISICNNENYTLPNGTVVNSNGNYFSNLTSINGCDSIIETVLNVISPNITTSLSGITITANAFTPSYQWLDCNNAFQIIAGETSASFTPSVNGSYAVSVNEDGCIDTSACVTISDVGIETNSAMQFTVYPNPTGGMYTIENSKEVNVSFWIYTLAGQCVEQGQLYPGSNSMNISALTNGVYLLHIHYEGEIYRTKLTLTH